MGKTLNARVNISTMEKFNPYSSNKQSLAYNIINNAQTKANETELRLTPLTIPLKETCSSVEKELSIAADDYGTSYYYRGGVEDNYVNFAGMCWRIVRIEGDGSIKLILASEKACNIANLSTSSGYATDGAAGTQGTILKTHYGYKKVADTNIFVNDYVSSKDDNENSARTKLNEWLERKIISESDKALLKNDAWCIDQTNAYNGTGKIIGTSSNLINGEANFRYAAGNRYYVTKTPSYKCETTGVDGDIDINKVGMLTMDEIAYAGGRAYMNKNYYISSEATAHEWLTLSLLKFSSSENFGGTYQFTVLPTGDLYDDSSIVTSARIAVRPVITIANGTGITGGDGTIENPYTVS